MTWAAYLDHLDVVTDRARRALADGDGLAAAAAVTELAAGREGLGPVPAPLTDRARRALDGLASLDVAMREAMGRLEPELALLGRVRRAEVPAQYVDTSA